MKRRRKSSISDSSLRSSQMSSSSTLRQKSGLKNIELKGRVSTLESELTVANSRLSEMASQLAEARRESERHAESVLVAVKSSAEKSQSYEDQLAKLNSLADAQRLRIQELEFGEAKVS